MKITLKKHILILLSIILIIGFIPVKGASAVYAETRVLEIKGSVLKKAVNAYNSLASGNLPFIESAADYEDFKDIAQYFSKSGNSYRLDISSKDIVILDMDDTAHIPANSVIDCAFEIQGVRTLFIDGDFSVNGNFILNGESAIAMNNKDSLIMVMNFDNDEKRIFQCYGLINIQNNDTLAIDVYGDFNLRKGTINAQNCTGDVVYANSINLYKGRIDASDIYNMLSAKEGDLNIYNGTYNINSNNYAFYSKNNINISGGYIYINNLKTISFFADQDINFTGGKIRIGDGKIGLCSYNGTISINGGYYNCTADDTPIVAYKGIVISDSMKIINPVDGKIEKVLMNGIRNDDPYMYTICSSETAVFKVEIDKAPQDNDQSGSENNTNNGNKNTNNASDDNGSSKNNNSNDSDGSDKQAARYSNEWVDGKWYNESGICDYEGTLEWKKNSTGWWVEDSKGWYPVSQWQKIDGKWYYFTATGYMDYSEYREGYWLGADGALVDGYYGKWKSNSTGWWFEDTSGWYPYSGWLWVDGSCYYFEASGYMATNRYIDGYWVGADGAWR